MISSVGLTFALGFLSSNEIKAQGALNAGLREKKSRCLRISDYTDKHLASPVDQTFALQWVQDYVRLAVHAHPTHTHDRILDRTVWW